MSEKRQPNKQYNEMTAILWCLVAGVVTLVLLFVWASMFPVFAK